MKYTFFFIITILSLSCNQETDKPQNQNTQNFSKKEPDKAVFLIYGELAPTGYVEEKDSSITQKFGFCVHRITGCEVTPELIDSVKVINQKSSSMMQSKYGKDWIQKFEKETNMKLAIPNVE
ncbi:hypothetical protein AD998_12550 [bacterium 336/3]|nr:hypothetical protein AD998_12550 [bacterium 336/3]